MFEKSHQPHVFSVLPGCDFPKTVIEGLLARSDPQNPEKLARVTLFVNTERMRRRLHELFDAGQPLLLPRIRIITELGLDAAFSDIPPAVSSLRRRLEISQLIAKLLETQPDLAPRAAIFDLADSLAALVDEMQGEGVTSSVIRELDVSDQSGHWQRSLAFVNLVEKFFGASSNEPPDAESRQRMVIERLVQIWENDPPQDPVIIAGSTGSRGATNLLMQAVARLPQGALILPGFDGNLPGSVWSDLEDPMTSEDHPQFRFAKLLKSLGVKPENVSSWAELEPVSERRNALVSLALRPAPVTDQWQKEGPAFKGVKAASVGMTLVEAPSARMEAQAIALALREAAENGTSAALITPDRTLSRRVTAALDKWGIEPDDSAGRPLLLTAPGRLLRQIAELRGRKITGPDLLALLKHPLASTGNAARGDHLRHTRDLELGALRAKMAFPDADELAQWASHKKDRADWSEWVSALLRALAHAEFGALRTHLDDTLAAAVLVARGPGGTESGELWEKPAGKEAQRICAELHREADFGGDLSVADFTNLFTSVLSRGEVRDPVQPHPGIKIWGTLEARVQGADLVILGGLNDGSWPETQAADPWMNRAMRNKAGLLLPERRIGLSAHDFQQAIASEKVILSRSVRDDENETIPSRWLSRLTNLLGGMSEDGAAALKEIKARGQKLIDLAESLETAERIAPAPRPAPCPPVDARPKRLSVTRVSRLIRDPYAIYAESVLKLRPLPPLQQSPDAPLKGTILHKVMERFIQETMESGSIPAKNRLMEIAEQVMEKNAPWPAARILWLAKLEKVADIFLTDEQTRQSRATPIALEVHGEMPLTDTGFTLGGTADRIDQDISGALFIYDYKSGSVPTAAQQKSYDKQLLLEAVMAEAGAFKNLPAAPVSEVAYIGLGASPKFERIEIGQEIVGATHDELVSLVRAYSSRKQGYTARRIVETRNFSGDYDHLSRFGEWDYTATPLHQEVGP